LSVQITLVEPRVSTALSRLTGAPWRARSRTPTASDGVMVGSNPSGTLATRRPIAKLSAAARDSPAGVPLTPGQDGRSREQQRERLGELGQELPWPAPTAPAGQFVPWAVRRRDALRLVRPSGELRRSRNSRANGSRVLRYLRLAGERARLAPPASRSWSLVSPTGRSGPRPGHCSTGPAWLNRA
jgi:hypothetical protein